MRAMLLSGDLDMTCSLQSTTCDGDVPGHQKQISLLSTTSFTSIFHQADSTQQKTGNRAKLRFKDEATRNDSMCASEKRDRNILQQPKPVALSREGHEGMRIGEGLPK